ncbi:unnamed protein product [Arabis nemorensis]|uniref:RRM domain-containing protein n=1 Tax=Arabis nemorensis TaxID=586526 RepID=A0A565BZS3_9BRAS|nr:unnamed protein product [Arabis nemorensis]
MESSQKSFTKSFFKTEPEDNLETKVNLMIKTMERSVDLLQRIEAKVELLATKADLRTNLISDKPKNNLLDMNSPFKTPGFTSSFASSDNRRPAAYTPPQSTGVSGGNDDQTVIVKGFDSSLPESYIKSLLNQVSGAATGCAYVHLKEGVDKALKLNGSYMGGWKLVVEKATPVGERVGPSGGEGQWPYPYRCNGLRQCSFC